MKSDLYKEKLALTHFRLLSSRSMSEHLSPELERTAEAIVDGWYSDGRIDWIDFLERVEKYADVDLGSEMDSPLIRAIKKHVRVYRKL